MNTAGIEAVGVYGGSVYLDVSELAQYRGMDLQRFENLLIRQKSAALPYEDAVSLGVNAAKPVIDALSQAERDQIELLITCTESGLDFGKSLSTYIHHYLGLSRNCRLFEIKQACYSGTAGYQMALNFILSQTSPGAKALVVATDLSRVLVDETSDELTMDWEYFEPSGGAGAVALLVSDQPRIFQSDIGANGTYCFEVMDTCRPMPDSEAGDSDLSLLSYLDCCEQSFAAYRARVEGVSYQDSFNYLAFHTPFGGMVKGAHRHMMRRLLRSRPDEIDVDFETRVAPGLRLCQRIGNIMGATVLLSLTGAVLYGDYRTPQRIGCFSYGSGCASEFYSGVSTADGQRRLQDAPIQKALDLRHKLTMPQYEALLEGCKAVPFGTRNHQPDLDQVPDMKSCIADQSAQLGYQRLFLKEIKNFHREYDVL
ncbi:hydroxymethylglutaryl-CoA synthase family protein [Labrenzia sp. PHM005]|uniref:hydroxymethylglutaryl-CoA synthase family protein n=1 Tax=Labrenzia sp. PHM005 TaxID=2590016 RepID=UPI0011403E3D|nr:hydroxymethylglutaryl-CoA synthase [Labrenzia sp. PHM005]QDG75023.1 hydroxymethylglutaryl-CoA synthase family protein [Labrenzia sp. PHM005]